MVSSSEIAEWRKNPLEADLPDIIIQGNSARDRVAQWIVMRAQEPGITQAECARRMGIFPSHLSACISKGNREGWLKFEDPLAKLEYGLIPKAIENLEHFLDAKDKTVTIETAKGTIFPAYRVAKGVSEHAQTVLALKIEPASSSDGRIIEGNIVGKPKEIA